MKDKENIHKIKYGIIKGRSVIHSMECVSIRNARKEVIPVEDLDRYQLCKRCLKNCLSITDEEQKEYYVIIDLEMCNVPKSKYNEFHHRQEIIEIGAVMVNEQYEIISRFNTYVCPEYGKLDYTISRLTGITYSQLKTAPNIADALCTFYNWMGSKVSRIYAWSNSDYYQLKYEIQTKNLFTEQNQKILNTEWIDYQEVFDTRYEKERQISLEEALCLAEIDFQGYLHNGLDDAVNTAYLIKKLENDPDYQLAGCLERDKDEIDKALQYSLGELFTSALGEMYQNLPVG